MEEEEISIFQFHFTMLYFTMVFDRSGDLPLYKSSAIRGGMGQELLRQYCLGDHDRCEQCMLREKCIVQSIMYAPYQIRPDFVQEGESAGYSLSCVDFRRKVCAGDEMEFRIILYGDTVAFFHPILQALYSFGMTGLGKEHVTFRIQKIRNIDNEDILSENDIHLDKIKTLTAWDYVSAREADIRKRTELYLQMLSPCAVSYHGKIVKEISGEALVRSVWRRVYMQHLFEGFMVEPKPILEMPVVLEQQVESCLVGRYSGKKKEKTNLSGVTGWVKLGNISEEMLRLFLAGEISCIGKNIRFGFGVYRIKDGLGD